LPPPPAPEWHSSARGRRGEDCNVRAIGSARRRLGAAVPWRGRMNRQRPFRVGGAARRA
jgi:hypothetical protein